MPNGNRTIPDFCQIRLWANLDIISVPKAKRKKGSDTITGNGNCSLRIPSQLSIDGWASAIFANRFVEMTLKQRKQKREKHLLILRRNISCSYSNGLGESREGTMHRDDANWFISIHLTNIRGFASRFRMPFVFSFSWNWVPKNGWLGNSCIYSWWQCAWWLYAKNTWNRMKATPSKMLYRQPSMVLLSFRAFIIILIDV